MNFNLHAATHVFLILVIIAWHIFLLVRVSRAMVEYERWWVSTAWVAALFLSLAVTAGITFSTPA